MSRWRAGVLLLLGMLAAHAAAAEGETATGGRRLAAESSPYLLSHADDPVEWYPWGEEAFARARAEGKPVFLSIGYSSCHWCHVMAREVFADPEIAALLNARFVSVLVDREERPDVDEVYVTAVQLLIGSAGWPVSVFLTPKGEPFYGGGYFPPEAEGGLPAFPTLVRRLHDGWTGERRAEMESVAGRLTADVRAVLSARAEEEPEVPSLDAARAEVERWKARFDAEHGGFARPPAFRPKFPSHTALLLLVESWDRGDREAGRMVVETLRAIARSPLHDAERGGFHRYAVDREWSTPHYEKMLYDNALLAELYAAAAGRTEGEVRAELARAGRSTLDFLLAAMANPPGGGAGGFAASLDADEAFYAAEASNRPPPRADRTVLTGWNGLAVAAFAEGAPAFDEPRYLAAARAAAGLLLARPGAEGPEGGEPLRRALRDGAPAGPAQLEDYAFSLRGLLALAEAEPDDGRWLAAARELADEMEARLAAPGGGWFQAAPDPHLPLRARTVTGSNLPPGNAAAIVALLELAERLDRPGRPDRDAGREYRRLVERALGAFAAALDRFPGAVPGLALAVLRFHAAEPSRR